MKLKVGLRAKICMVLLPLIGGCTMTPEMAKLTSTSRLCNLYAVQGEDFLSPVIREELIARGAGYCMTPQYMREAQAASDQSRAMALQLGLQMMQNNRPYTLPMNQCVTRNVGGNLVTQCY